MFKTLKSICRVALLGISLVTLTACEGLPFRTSGPELAKPDTQPPVQAKPELPFEEPVRAPRELDADLVYSYLVGEIGAHRGELALAYRNYLHAANVAQDPYAAERATRIAVYLNDSAGALRAARRWVELAPNARDARMSLALLLEQSGKRSEAVAELEALVKISAALGDDGFLQIGRVLAKEGADALRPLMRDLVAAHDTDAHAHYALAMVAVAAKSFAEAEASLARAVELAPDWPEPVVMLARVRHAQGRIDLALSGLAEAVAGSTDSPQLRTAYARMLVDAGRHGDALVQFRRLLRDDRDNPDLIYAVAMLAMHEASWEEARDRWVQLRNLGGEHHMEATYFLAQVEERLGHDDVAAGLYASVNSGPLQMDAGLRLAQTEARKGELAKARDRLQRLRVLVPSRAVDAYLTEANLLKGAGQLNAARRLFDEALVSQPDNMDLLYARAMFAIELDDLPTMEGDLRHILSLNPDHAEALNALGYTLADRTDRYEEAFGYIMQAYRLQPENAAILDSLGWVYYRLGDFTNALKYLRQALEMDQDAEIAAHLGEVLWVTGDRDEARAVWRRGLSLVPDSRHILDAMRRFE